MTQQRSRCRDHCSHICENMRTVQILLSLLSVIAPLDATYRSWIPDTNFENASNWKEQRVPCGQDSAVFPGDQRVSVFVQSTHALTDLKFTKNEDFSQYVQLPTGKLQFPGPAQPQITNLICQDATGCLCGNDGMLQEICSVQLQHTGGKCPELPCAAPLQPVGHCCGICGVVISLDYSSAFSLETYRNRLIHTFLSLQKYSSVKLAISKVRSQSSVERLGAELKIQIVLMDEKEGSLAGGDALQLGYDIMADSETHGESFGITRAEMQFATGGLTSPHKGSMSAGAISGIVLGTLLGLLLVAAASYFLYRMDTCRLRYFVVFQFGRNRSTMEDTEPVDRKGFDNPIFESVAENIQGSDCSKDDLPEVTWHKTEFSNPAFDFNL
ncbi:protein amnionless isoform X2 [Ranitomeya variabilis]|uniref:protein amnionless isoform X2 n=1 Tax=Ranitomeya variabilis TaxID=490064 RepID=UPI0040575C62